jgi:lipopolysaccharide transport system permease protein
MTVKKFLREISTAPADIVKNLYYYRHLLLQMVIREIKGRFAGSIGGIVWHFIHPVLMLIVFLFVFVYIFRLRVSSTGGAAASAIYIIAGLFPWVILAEGLSRGTTSLIENANIIQKTAFPNEILPAKALLAPFFSYGAALLILLFYKIFSTGSVGIIFILPLILILQIFFTLGLVFLTSTVSVFFRDVMQLVHIVISFWIYLTPILYPISMLPEWAKTVMYFNPLFPFISVYQSLFVSGALDDWNMLLLSSLWAALFFVTGSFVFNKLKYEFADWL